MADQYVYSPIDFCADCYAAGFRVGKGLATILAIAGAETAGTYDPKITNTAGNSPPSTDRGIVQINSYWHPEVSDACAFDPKCAAVQAFRISNQGSSFTPWATYNNGSYKRYLQVAWMAIDAYGRITALNGDKDALNQQIAQLQVTAAASQQTIDGLKKQLAEFQAKYDQLNSADQQTVAQLQGQITDLTTQRDQAAVQAEAAQGRVKQIETNIDNFIKDFRAELLG